MSLIIIAGVYGLQALIFLIKRQWQHIGWMIIYILAYPVYSFILPIYSFWKQDDFSWGNTRIVIGEKGDKKVVAIQDEGFDPRSIPLQRWDDYAATNNLPGRRGNGTYGEKGFENGYHDDPGMMEMDDMHSTYSSIKPSTILTGFPQQQTYMAPPHSPAAPYGMTNRASTMTGLTQFRDQPVSVHGRQMSMMSLGSQARLKSPSPNPYQDTSRSPYQSGFGMQHAASRPSLLGMATSRPTSTVMDFRTVPSAGPSDYEIVDAIRAVLAEVDLDKVTKKQVRALVEQRLQCEVPAGDRRAFLDKAIDGELANM
jgi:chitin synthase